MALSAAVVWAKAARPAARRGRGSASGECGACTNRRIQFGYDANGNLTTLTPPGGHAHGFDITPVDQTDRYRPPSAGLSAYLTQYRYNKDHQLFRIERPDSANVRIDYDHVKARPTAIVIPRGTSNFTYSDTSGCVKTLSSPDGVTLTYGYDGPLVTYEGWSGNVAGSVAHTYDADFRVVSQSVNNGSPVTLSYDHDGLLTGVGSLVIHRLTDTGAVDSTTLSSCTTRQDYSAFGELANLRYDAGASEKFLQSLARDNLGRITESDETVLGTVTTKAYAYSDSGFLKTVTTNGSVTERYGYDGNGNRTRFEGVGTDTASASYDDQDRMLRYKDTRYTYSAAGELMKAKTGTDSTLYTYDPLGNLVTVVFATGNRIDYLIDGRNRRVGRKFNGTLQKQWLYQDQLEPVAELDGSGALVSRFVYGTRSNVPDYMVNGGITYRIIADHLGSVRLVIDASADTVAESMTYDGYGRLLADTSPGFQPFGYAGGLWDVTTGLVRFGARDYDAKTGRWTSKDPMIFQAGEDNLYAYVAADPLNSIDPRGLIRDTGEEGPQHPSSTPCLTGPYSGRDALDALLSSLRIREAIRGEARLRAFSTPAAKDAWMHAESAYRISTRFGAETAFDMGVLNEWLTQWRNNSPEDTEHDFMNNWQGLSYGLNGDQLLQRGLLFKSPQERIRAR